ncbi:MAG: sulfur oxidation protein SoxY [Betaproteobacteria bacterium]|nr:sulfur oxidation protein SoxY [Betaproteobacteria bacterium]NBY33164.1 sulfur oxidation protein SoxY [Betaproteobacteria bacterium]NDF05039.1 sulfur oxidation protein SoxY [Betaproteobacteria bacterium]
MRSRLLSRRLSILAIFQTTLAASVGGFWLGSAKAQVDKLTITGLSEARLRTFEEMVRPYVQNQELKKERVTLSLPMLADNGHMVPLSLKIDSPMTEASHITHVYLISQRNPVPLMAKFVMGPWSGRADLSTRVRLSGNQNVIALARLSDGNFIYDVQEVVVTEAACVDNG